MKQILWRIKLYFWWRNQKKFMRDNPRPQPQPTELELDSILMRRPNGGIE